MLKLLFLLGVSYASTIQEGWFCQEINHPCALEIASELLRENPDDIEAHALYLISSGKNNPFVLQTYKEQYEEKQTDRTTMLYAAAMYQMNRKAFCNDNIIDIVAKSPKETDLQYGTLRLQLLHQNACQKKIKLHTAVKLIKLGKEYDGAQEIRLKMLIKREKCQMIADETQEFLQREPWSIDVFSPIYRSKNPTCLELQQPVLEKAIEIINGNSFAEIYAAINILEASGDTKHIENAYRKIDTLTKGRFAIFDSYVQNIIDDANNQPTLQMKIDALQEIEPLVSDTLQFEYKSQLAYLYRKIGDQETANGIMDDLLVQPDTDPISVNSYYYTLAKEGLRLEEGLQKMDALIERSIVNDIPPSLNSYDANWLLEVQYKNSMLYDTRGFIHYQLENYQMARVDFEKSLQNLPDVPETLSHLALTLEKLGEPSEMVFKMALIAMSFSPRDASLRSQLIACVKRNYHSDHLWSSTQKDDFLHTFMTAYALEWEEAHPLVGQKTPITEFDIVHGENGSLVDGTGPVVVDLWATWCTPCIANKPYLQNVADRFKENGVRVVSLSFDQNKDEVLSFYQDLPRPSYDVGWLGEKGFDLFAINVIPSLFVLDSNGVVQRYFHNYNFDSEELEVYLEELLNASN